MRFNKSFQCTMFESFCLAVSSLCFCANETSQSQTTHQSLLQQAEQTEVIVRQPQAFLYATYQLDLTDPTASTSQPTDRPLPPNRFQLQLYNSYNGTHLIYQFDQALFRATVLQPSLVLNYEKGSPPPPPARELSISLSRSNSILILRVRLLAAPSAPQPTTQTESSRLLDQQPPSYSSLAH